MRSVKINGQHIGNVAKAPDGSWKAWSAISKVSVNGKAQCFTAKTRTECTNWLKIVAETQMGASKGLDQAP
jgi:hypothetical protein